VRFDWSQIESSNYRAYVANLRNVRCPEQTIRDIITADVGKLFSAKRRELGLDGSGNGAWSRQEEAQLIASLLDSTQTPAPLAAQPADQGQENRVVSSEPEMPLVFQSVDFGALDLNDGQIAAIQNLQQRFTAAVGGTNQNPSDPAYRDRWEKAQPETDELLEGMIGSEAFQNYQLALRGVKFTNGAPQDAQP
jgi:hypothetical protein